MAATVSGQKTTTVQTAPHLATTTINTILGTAPENITLKQLAQLQDAINRVGGTHSDSTTIGTILS